LALCKSRRLTGVHIALTIPFVPGPRCLSAGGRFPPRGSLRLPWALSLKLHATAPRSHVQVGTAEEQQASSRIM
jgi:hypothetical protein